MDMICCSAGNEGQRRTAFRLSVDLRGAAMGWAEAWANALNQQNRRLYARAVHRTKESRSWTDNVGGFLFGHDDLPPS